MFAFPNEGIYNPGRKSFEGVIGGTFPKVPPKNRAPHPCGLTTLRFLRFGDHFEGGAALGVGDGEATEDTGDLLDT